MEAKALMRATQETEARAEQAVHKEHNTTHAPQDPNTKDQTGHRENQWTRLTPTGKRTTREKTV
jgi:hypothetical protein